MIRRPLIALTTALLSSVALAITPAQRTHLNQVLSEMGATVVDCPASLSASVDLCATYSGTPELAMKAWDLYSSWESKVAMTATHNAPWRQSSNGINTASFRLKDGSLYVVSLGRSGTKVDLVVATSDTVANAPAAAPQSRLGAPSTVVNDQAAPTRRGPLIIGGGGTQSYGVIGPVKELTRRTMKVDANGKETLSNTLKATFLPDGRLLSSSITDATGKQTDSTQNVYVGGRLVERRMTDKDGTKTLKYEYDAAGNLTARSEFDGAGQKVEVTRYEAKPNGYTTAEYGPTGEATRRTYVVQDAEGHDVAEEAFSKKSTPASISTSTYVDGQKTYQMIELPGSLKIELWYEQGRTTRTKTTASGALASALNSESVYKYEMPDSRGNYLKKLEGKEAISFGEKKFVPEEIEYLEIQYH